MKDSSRKILKKIGAGLMLGLSLFNLGAAWNKAEGWNMAKRSKNLREKEKDRIDSEVALFAEVAEEEAEKAIREKSISQQEQTEEVIVLTVSQKIYRASAIGAMSVALGIFATSMIFNLPFALGKGMLSLLPGNPHLAVLSLSANAELVDVGDQFSVDINLDSAGEKVDSLKIVFPYDPNLISFEKNIPSSGWEIKENQVSDNRRELILLNDEKTFIPRNFVKENFVRVIFKSKKTASGKDIIFSLDQSRSLVVSKNDQMGRNILGETRSEKISFSNNIVQSMMCQKVGGSVGPIDFWKNFVQGDLSKPRADYWQDFGDSIGMICAHDGDYVYLVVVSGEKNIDNFKVVNNQISQNFDAPDYFWEDGSFDFRLYQFSSNGKTEINNLKFEIQNDFLNKREWPIEGVGKIIFE